MRRFVQPPTSELENEWTRLSIERRREIVRRALEPLRPIEGTGLTDELRAEGLSDALVGWIGEEADEWQRHFRSVTLKSIVENALPATKSDRLNATLVAFIVFLVGLIWTLQEFRTLDAGTFSIGILPALILLLVGWISFRRTLVRLLREFWTGRQKRPRR